MRLLAPMSENAAVEAEIAALLIETLNLEDVEPADIAPAAPLFSTDDGGLGLDSIDALEIAQALSIKYGIHLSADDEQNKSTFRSLRSLSDYVVAHRTAA